LCIATASLFFTILTNCNNLTDIFSEKIKPIDEKIISKKIYDLLIEKDKNFEYEASIYINDIKNELELLILVVSIIEVLSNSVYLKKIEILTKTQKTVTSLKKILKELFNQN